MPPDWSSRLVSRVAQTHLPPRQVDVTDTPFTTMVCEVPSTQPLMTGPPPPMAPPGLGVLPPELEPPVEPPVLPPVEPPVLPPEFEPPVLAGGV